MFSNITSNLLRSFFLMVVQESMNFYGVSTYIYWYMHTYCFEINPYHCCFKFFDLLILKLSAKHLHNHEVFETCMVQTDRFSLKHILKM